MSAIFSAETAPDAPGAQADTARYWAYRLAAWALLNLGEDAASLAFLFC
ncbi:hypothetical protein PSQ20_00305 [Curvibacter sp. RS43]|nr:hypothetical protein [Curvibacter sp. RS43]MDD0808765.1 hypothetical protein [Curvibacter sp. RS43]